MFLYKGKKVIKVLLVVDKGINRKLVIIFGAEKFLKRRLLLLEVQVVKQPSHAMENGDITHSEYKFLLNLCDGLDDVGQVGEDLSVLLVFGCGLGQV